MKFLKKLFIAIALLFTLQGVASAGISGPMGPGYGQAYTDVKTTPGRVLGTTYTNSSGKPIIVSISALGTAASQVATITVGGVVCAGSATHSSSYRIDLKCLVSVGATYVVTFSGATLNSWIELR